MLTVTNCSCHAKEEESLLLDREACQYKSIFLTKDSVAEAKKAASSLCALVSNVVHGRLDNGFAVIRPPGHHAEPGLAGGYCVINNVAVAAAYARAKLGVKRILIVDWVSAEFLLFCVSDPRRTGTNSSLVFGVFISEPLIFNFSHVCPKRAVHESVDLGFQDVHHGNGTQAIFLNDPNVMYFSVHRWQGGNFFPFLQNGGPTNLGIGKGVGFNINVGWSRKGMGDDEYYAVWEHILLPVAKEYQPELILISAGFDAADGDLGECHVTPECFGELTRALKEANLANGRIVATLEGGYVRSVLGQCVVSVVKSLLDKNSNDRSTNTSKTQAMCNEEQNDGSTLQETHRNNNNLKTRVQFPLENIDSFAAKNIQATISAHKAFWKCLGGVGRDATK
jgi:acetoin utilization deacetylase AcuC-like enzyme